MAYRKGAYAHPIRRFVENWHQNMMNPYLWFGPLVGREPVEPLFFRNQHANNKDWHK